MKMIDKITFIDFHASVFGYSFCSCCIDQALIKDISASNVGNKMTT